MTKYEDIVKLKQKVRDAELETSLVKAVGMNSPEMRAAQAKIKELTEDNLNLRRKITVMEQEALELFMENKLKK